MCNYFSAEEADICAVFLAASRNPETLENHQSFNTMAGGCYLLIHST
jgi:hypothetical protein